MATLYLSNRDNMKLTGMTGEAIEAVLENDAGVLRSGLVTIQANNRTVRINPRAVVYVLDDE
jgi:hypothetical protein